MSSEKKCPETPPKPKDGESQKLVEHLRSAHKSKEAMIETHFENQILQAYFNDELLGMKPFNVSYFQSKSRQIMYRSILERVNFVYGYPFV